MKFGVGISIFLLVACSGVKTIGIQSEATPIDEKLSGDTEMDAMISPYKDSLDNQMNEVIAVALGDFIAERPSGTLNNWTADAILHSQIAQARLEAPTFCLLNKGGLRTSINKGEVTIGDMYKVMPFDNEIVWVKMPVSSIKDIEKYLKTSGGEPISGAKIVGGKLLIDGMNERVSHFWIITSDYLMNGGDNMTFFEQSLSRSHTGVLMRDAMIQEARQQGELVPNTENRMQF